MLGSVQQPAVANEIPLPKGQAPLATHHYLEGFLAVPDVIVEKLLVETRGKENNRKSDVVHWAVGRQGSPTKVTIRSQDGFVREKRRRTKTRFSLG